jgi:putative peptidoglycan lipid II flippase
VGLALATSLSAVLNASLLWWGLRKAGIYQAQPGWPIFMVRLVAACAAMALIIVWMVPGTEQWFNWGWQRKVLEMTLLVSAGIGVFALTLFVTGMRMRHLRQI